MKTLFAYNEIKNFHNLSFDVLTSQELALVKGGREADYYVGL